MGQGPGIEPEQGVQYVSAHVPVTHMLINCGKNKIVGFPFKVAVDTCDVL